MRRYVPPSSSWPRRLSFLRLLLLRRQRSLPTSHQQCRICESTQRYEPEGLLRSDCQYTQVELRIGGGLWVGAPACQKLLGRKTSRRLVKPAGPVHVSVIVSSLAHILFFACLRVRPLGPCPAT